MVSSDRALSTFYRLSIVAMSPSAAVNFGRNFQCKAEI